MLLTKPSSSHHANQKNTTTNNHHTHHKPIKPHKTNTNTNNQKKQKHPQKTNPTNRLKDDTETTRASWFVYPSAMEIYTENDFRIRNQGTTGSPSFMVMDSSRNKQNQCYYITKWVPTCKKNALFSVVWKFCVTVRENSSTNGTQACRYREAVTTA